MPFSFRFRRPTILPVLALGLTALLGGCVEVPSGYGYGNGYSQGYGHGHGYSQGYGYSHTQAYAAPARYAGGYGQQNHHRYDRDRW